MLDKPNDHPLTQKQFGLLREMIKQFAPQFALVGYADDGVPIALTEHDGSWRMLDALATRLRLEAATIERRSCIHLYQEQLADDDADE